MKIAQTFLLLLIFLACHQAFSGSVYQCKDNHDHVTLSDTPCPTTSETQKVTPLDRDRRADAADAKLSIAKPLRKTLCDVHRDAIKNLDQRLISAYQRNDLAEQKRIVDDRRRWGETMTKYGC